MPKPFVSIIICTYNRPNLLELSLRSAMTQDYPVDNFEIIVINNGADHQVRKIVNNLKGISKNKIAYSLEEKKGVSHARTKGVMLATGKIVAFLDDDETAPENWLQELIQPYDIDNNIGCVGGRIIPIFPNCKPPSWYSKEIQGFFGGVDNGHGMHEINPKTDYLGAGNISFKKKLVVDFGMFDTRLGVRDNISYAGEETALYLKMLKEKYKVYYNPKAVTYHFVEKKRISKLYLYKRAFQNGISDAIYDNLSVEFIDSDFTKLTTLGSQYLIILFNNIGSFIKRASALNQSSLRARLAILRSLGKIVGFFKTIFSL